jgi:hypothetical protein
MFHFKHLLEDKSVKHIENTESRMNAKFTSAQAFGRTRRPIRPASLALRTFSNNGTIVEFELQAKYSQGRPETIIQDKRECRQHNIEVYQPNYCTANS